MFDKIYVLALLSQLVQMVFLWRFKNTRLNKSFILFYFFCISLNYTWKWLLISHFPEKVKLKLLKYLQCLGESILFKEITKNELLIILLIECCISPPPPSAMLLWVQTLRTWKDFTSYSYIFLEMIIAHI